MDLFSAAAILGYAPVMNLDLPFVGMVDMGPALMATAIFLGLTVLFALVRGVVLVRLKAFSGRTATDIDDAVIDAVRRIRPWVYSVAALYMALQLFAFPHAIDLAIRAVFLLTVVWQAVEITLAFIRYGTHRIIEKDEDADGVTDPGSAMASEMIILLARIVLWALGGLFVLSNLGVEVTSLIAGLGIGGIAVAFALQGILSDLFASFSIYFDKPFRIGDFIIVGSNMGTVERIGIKSTRIRTLQGEELVISNAELTSARVQNFKKMQERRIVFTFGITYETPYAAVSEVPGMVRSLIERTADVRFDRAHFASYGDSALLFEVVYHVLSEDYNIYMDRQQEINFGLMQVFTEAGIEFAYPTQTVYVKQ